MNKYCDNVVFDTAENVCCFITNNPQLEIVAITFTEKKFYIFYRKGVQNG